MEKNLLSTCGGLSCNTTLAQKGRSQKYKGAEKPDMSDDPGKKRESNINQTVV